MKSNDLTLDLNPVNLRDYLVAKLPVISTAPSDCRLYEHLIEIGETPMQFANALATLEDGCLPDSPRKRCGRSPCRLRAKSVPVE